MAIALLLFILHGLDPRMSVALQLCVSIAVIGYAIALVHRRLGMRARHWLSFRVGGGHVRRHYLRDIGASAAFTISEILAYNAPYFTIAAATQDARPMLVFDFFFKMSRSLSMLVRAMVEAALPRITRAFHAGDRARLRQLVKRSSGAALFFALVASAALLLLGVWLFAKLFTGGAGLARADMQLG